jgi:hypothetical protein
MDARLWQAGWFLARYSAVPWEARPVRQWGSLSMAQRLLA